MWFRTPASPEEMHAGRDPAARGGTGQGPREQAKKEGEEQEVAQGGVHRERCTALKVTHEAARRWKSPRAQPVSDQPQSVLGTPQGSRKKTENNRKESPSRTGTSQKMPTCQLNTDARVTSRGPEEAQRAGPPHIRETSLSQGSRPRKLARREPPEFGYVAEGVKPSSGHPRAQLGHTHKYRHTPTSRHAQETRNSHKLAIPHMLDHAEWVTG